jgi:GT2 family glycosyltransferase
MISIICVYNNKKILNEWLLRSLENQTARYELILIDNTDNKFKSATKALNYGGKKAKGKYIMFVHQDVRFSSNTWLKDAVNMLNSLPDVGIAGVAGKRDIRGFIESRRIISNIVHGIPPKFAGNIKIHNPEKVQTLDECLFVIPKRVFDMLQFDEENIDTWHLYAVDYALSVKKLGFNVYVLPLKIHHRSTGDPIPTDYFKSLRKLLKKHKKNYQHVNTTCGNWYTFYPFVLQKLLFATELCYYMFRNMSLRNIADGSLYFRTILNLIRG